MKSEQAVLPNPCLEEEEEEEEEDLQLKIIKDKEHAFLLFVI
jgi:hypothetical protein